MTRQCKICASKLRNDIDELLVSGNYTAEYISKYACDRGLIISHSTVRRHGTLHVIGYNPSQNTSEVRKLDKKPPKLSLIDFDEYLKSLGIDRNIVENLDEFFEENLSAYQKGMNLLMFKTMTVLNGKLDRTMQNEDKFPSDEIKALKMMTEAFNKATAVEKFIDENTAVNHLETLGYDLRRNITI